MNPRVLIVEDQRALAEAMAGFLSRHRIDADVSGDGIEALEKYASIPYDLLVVDLQIPRLNGVELIRKIRSTNRGRDLPIIISTGIYKGENYAKKARDTFGVKYYLEKPYPQNVFLEAVKKSIVTDSAPPAQKTAAPPSKAVAGAVGEGPKVKIIPADETSLVDREPPRDIIPASRPVAAPPNKTPATAAKPTAAVGNIRPRAALQGNFRDIGFGDLLMDARRKKLTGVLYVTKDEDEWTITFLNGYPAGVRTKKPDYSFGNFLFCNGRLSLMEYQIYQGKLQNGGEAEETLIKMGALLPAEFVAEKTRYGEEMLIQMFAWGEADFTFQVWPPLPDSAPLQCYNLANVIHQGYRRHLSEMSEAELKNEAAGKFPALTPAFYDFQMHLSITPAEALFLDRIDGSIQFESVLPAAAEEAAKMVRALKAFLTLGMVELHDRAGSFRVEAPFPIRDRDAAPVGLAVEEQEPDELEKESAGDAEPVPQPVEEGFDDLMDDLEESLTDVVSEFQPLEEKKELENAAAAKHAEAAAQTAQQDTSEKALLDFWRDMAGKSYYEILGMKNPQAFEFSKMKQEYFRLTKLFSPEKYISASGETLAKSEEVLSALATAYNTLSNVVSKEKYDEMLATKQKSTGVPGSAKDHDKMQAEVAFQSGMAFLAMEDYDSAEKAFNEALSYAPNTPDIMAHYAWSVYNKNRKSKTVQKRVEELLHSALKQKPRCAAALAYRGVLLLDDERVSLAEADFKKALSINPRYKFALKGMRMIEQKKMAEKKSLFGRFKK